MGKPKVFPCPFPFLKGGCRGVSLVIFSKHVFQDLPKLFWQVPQQLATSRVFLKEELSNRICSFPMASYDLSSLFPEVACIQSFLYIYQHKIAWLVSKFYTIQLQCHLILNSIHIH
jgi:hypothetical protein